MDGFTRGRAFTPVEAGPIGSVEPRRNRDSLFLMARIQLGRSPTWNDVRVRNLSAGGLMAELDAALPIDTPVALELRGIGHVAGRVAWQAEGRTGIAFDMEIDPLKARKPVGKGAKSGTAAMIVPR